VQSPEGELTTMACGARLRIVRVQDWAAIDAEVRDIVLRVWAVEPIIWDGQLIIPIGRNSSAIEKLRASVEWVRSRTESSVRELGTARDKELPNLDWLDCFVREHEEHEQ
jgi:hypothetical protein